MVVPEKLSLLLVQIHFCYREDHCAKPEQKHKHSGQDTDTNVTVDLCWFVVVCSSDMLERSFA